MSMEIHPVLSPIYQQSHRSSSFDSGFLSVSQYDLFTRNEQKSDPLMSSELSSFGNVIKPRVPSSIEAPARTMTADAKSQKHVRSELGLSSNERPSSAWSHDDDTTLMRARAQGMNWAPIAATYFPSKTPNACRKRHERLMEKKITENGDGVHFEDMARAYAESRELMWKIMADKVGEKWQNVEARCMEKGLKILQSAARARRVGRGNFTNGSGIGLDTRYERVPADSNSHVKSKLSRTGNTSGSVSTISNADFSERHLQHRSDDSGHNERVSPKQAVLSAGHQLETCETSSLGLPSSATALATSINDVSQLRTSEIMRNPTHMSHSSSTSLGFGSPNVKLDVSILGLDADLDLLSPSQCIAEHGNIQRYTLKQSFFWFENRDRSSINLEDRRMFVSSIHTPETFYVESKLPTECPVRLLESSWQEFINTDNVFLRHRSGSLRHGKRSRHSQGSVQDCIHAFQNWLSRPGSVVDKVITATASRSEIDQNFPVHVTSLITSRNILVSLCRTIQFLHQRGVCREELNLFVEDRPKVIRLISIPLERFASLARQLNLIVGSLSWAMHGGFEILVSLGFENLRTLVSHHWLNPVLENGHLEKLCDCSSLDGLAAHWRYLARVLDLALIAYCSSHLVSTTEEHSLLYQLKPDSVFEIPNSNSVFAPASLECLDEFVQGAEVWTLCHVDHLVEVSKTSIQPSSSITPAASTRFGVSSAYVSASIESLADIWGPVWRLEKNYSQEKDYYYTLGAGAIGKWSTNQASSPVIILSNETLSHFVSSRDQMEHVISPFDEDTGSRLLIGVAQTSGMVQNETCRTSPHECLQGKDLRPHGTSVSTRFNATTTYTFGIGYSGTQIGVSKQYQRHPSITRKQSLVQKWTMWPDKRNPYTLLPWCGIEVSLCTRNARRRRLIHLLGSNTMAPYIDTIKWENSDCGEAFKQALAAEDLQAFPMLYSERVEWRTELGKAVGYLLTALVNTGIGHSGDLEVYTRTDSMDPDQILTLASKTHTWAGLLKDTERSATFAITTSDCLSFPYALLDCPGQRCRGRLFKKPQYTVLETAVAPVSSADAPSITDKASWSEGIPPGGRLRLQSSRSDMLKVVHYLPKGEILATWSASEYIKAALLGLPNNATNVRFQESADDGTYQLLTTAKVYVISEKASGLKTLRSSDASNYSMDTTMTDSSLLTPSTNPTTSSSSPYPGCHPEALRRADSHPQAVTCKQCELANMTPISSTPLPANNMMSNSLSSAWNTGLFPWDSAPACDNSDSPRRHVSRRLRSPCRGINGTTKRSRRC